MAKLTNDLIRIFNQTLNGGVTTCGNTCCTVGSMNSTVSNFLKPDESYTNKWSEIGSASYLDIPLESSVLYAVLEWHSTIANNLTNGDMTDHYTPIKFITPISENLISINPTASEEAFYTDLNNDKVSVKWADVTNLVKQAGNGYYTVQGIPTATIGNLLNHNQAPGWSLTVVYKGSKLPKRTIVVKMGIKQAMYTIPKANSAITINEFTAPSVPKKSYITIVASNGDSNYYEGVSIYNNISLINDTSINYKLGNSVDSTYEYPNTGDIVPYDNIFSGIIMKTNIESQDYGKIETRGTLGNKNNQAFDAIKQQSFEGNRSKLDIVSFDISNKITANQNQVILAVDTKKIPAGSPKIILTALQIDQTDKPTVDNSINIVLKKELDKTIAFVDEIIAIKITISNVGTKDINQVVLNDGIPYNMEFIANSLKVNGSSIQGTNLPSSGINIGNIPVKVNSTISYNIKVKSSQAYNMVGVSPTISYRYVDSYQNQVSDSLMGLTDYLKINQTPSVPTITVTKNSMTSGAYLNDAISYKITISNPLGPIVTNVNLVDKISQGANLVLGSLIINGNLSWESTLPSSISIGNLAAGASVVVSYQVTFSVAPTTNPVSIVPVVNYSYVDANNATQNGTVTGTSDSLLVATTTKPTPVTNTVKDIYINTLTGGVAITGNALMIVGSSNNIGTQFITQAGGTTTDWKQNGSLAVLDIPSGSTIVKAYLNWYGSVAVGDTEMAEAYDPVTFKTPTSTFNVFATGEARFYEALNYVHSSKWADVTSYVTQNGAGGYAVNRVPSNQNASVGNSGKTGWSLIVIYSKSTLPTRFVDVKAGLMPNNGNFTKTERAVTFTGFTVPQTPGKSYFTMVAADGSPNVQNGISVYNNISQIANTGAAYQLGNTSPSTGADPGTMPKVPYDNVFGGFIMNTNTDGTSYGIIDTTGTLGSKNNSPYNINSQPSYAGNRAKHDLVSFDISSKMSAGQNQLVSVVEMLNGSEWILGMIYALQVDVASNSVVPPVMSLSKKSGRNAAYLGDIITYTMTISNNMGITAKGVVLAEKLAQGATFVANSLTVNGTVVSGTSLPSSGVTVGDISVGSSATVSYKITFSVTPTTNPVSNAPIINYSYVDGSGATQSASFTGTTGSITIATISKPSIIVNSVTDVFTRIMKGGVAITGNTLMVTGSINNTAREYITNAGTLTTDWTMNGSGAYLDMPTGSTVTTAILQWYGSIAIGGSEMSEGYDAVSFATPTQTVSVIASQEARFSEDSTHIHSVKWTDVTSYVNSTGLYFLNRVPSAQNASTDHSGKTGWSLIVIYSNASLSNRFINVKLGLMPNNNSFTKTQRAVTFNGFTVPQTPGKAHFMMVAADGVPNIKNGISIYNNISQISSTGANYQVGNSSPSTGANPGTNPILPYDNIFGGFIMNTNTESTSYGQIDTRGTLGNKNNSPYNIGSQQSTIGNRTKHDIVAFDISSKITANQNTLVGVVEMLDNNEWILGTAYAVQVDVSSTAVTAPTITLGKTSDKTTANTGETITYTITVGNTAGTTARSVMLMETVPQGASFVQNSLIVNGSGINGTTLPTTGIPVGNIAVSANSIVTYKIIFNLIPTVNPVANKPVVNYSYIDSNNLTQNSSFTGTTNSLTINSSITPPSITANKVSDKTTANLGDMITYTITVGKTAGTVANSVMLMETVPQGASFVQNSLIVNGSGINGTTLPTTGISLGSISGNSSIIVSYKIIFNSIPSTNPLSINPVVKYSYLDGNNINQNMSFTGTSNSLTINIAAPILSLTKVSDKTSADLEQIITYTITIKNNGGTTANSIMLMESIPQSSSFISNSLVINGLGQNGTTLPSSGISIGNITVGSTVIVIYKIKFSSMPSTNPVVNNPLINYSYVNSSNISQNVSYTGTSTALTVTQPVVAPMLNANRTANKTSANIGDTITYTTQVKNTTTTTTTNVMLVEPILAGQNINVNSIKVNGVAINNAAVQSIVTFSTSLTIPIGDLAPNSTAIVVYDSNFTTATSNTLSSNSSLNYSYIDSSGVTQTTSTTGTIVTAAPVMSVEKSSDKISATVGDIVTYTIDVKNAGGTTSNSIMLMELLPQGASFVINSLTINGNVSIGSNLPSSGVNIGMLVINSTSRVIYKVIFNSVPTINPVKNNPIINYSYVDSNNVNQSLSFTGVSTSLTVNSTLFTPPTITADKTSNKTSANIGDIITYTVIIKNTGGSSANSVMLMDSIPQGANLIQNSLMVNGSPINLSTIPTSGLSINNIAAGATTTVVYKINFSFVPTTNPVSNKPKVNYSYTDAANSTVQNSITGTTTDLMVQQTASSPVIMINKTIDKVIAMIGDVITFTITVSNINGVTANSAVLDEIIPQGASFVQNSLIVNGAQITGVALPSGGITLGNMSVGSSIIISYKIIFNSVPSSNPLTLNSSVRYNYLDSNNLNQSATMSGIGTNVLITSQPTIINGMPTITAVKSADKTAIGLNDQVKFTIVINNGSGGTASNLILLENMPINASLIPNSLMVNGTAITSSALPVYGISLGSLSPSQSVTVSYIVSFYQLPQSNPFAVNPVLNYSYKDSNGREQKSSMTGTSSNSVLVTENPIGKVDFYSNKINAASGEIVTYTLIIQNNTDVSAKNIKIQNVIPSGMTYIAGSLKVNNASVSGDLNTGLSISDITSNQKTIITFDLRVN